MKKIFESYSLLIIFTVASAIVFFVSLYSRSLNNFFIKTSEKNITQRMSESSKRLSAMITAEELSMYREEKDMNLQSYKDLRLRLLSFSIEADVLYAYYMRVENGMVQYIADNDFDDSTRVGLDTPPMEAALLPGILPILDGKSGVTELGMYAPDWDGLISAYSPVFDSSGNVIAICGVDVNDEIIVRTRQRSKFLWTMELISVVIVFLSGMYGFFKYRREAEAAKSVSDEIGRQNKLFETTNQVSSILLEPETDNFYETIRKSMSIMAEVIGVDRITVWENSGTGDVLSFSLRCELEDGNFNQRENGELAPAIQFDRYRPERNHSWKNMLMMGEYLNSIIRDMPAAEQAELTIRNIKSFLVVPVFLHDHFWGFVGFDHCREEKLFPSGEVFILRSASRMLANAVIRNKMSENLVTAKNLAEQSNRSKSIFLSQMSHEIRTPMNAILGIAEIHLRDETIQQVTKEAFGRIYESGDLLLKIINDILDLSKIEAGKLELSIVKYDIPSLINDTAQLNLMRYESKPIEFCIEADENIPVYLYGDELRIKQVLNNILSNAFKYTDEGKIEFAVSAETDNADNATLVFRISDTGQGMTEDQIARLFDEYSRFNLNTNRTIVGAGLGMSITKRLVDLMNGSIAVQSESGKGSVVTVRVPQKLAGTEVFGSEVVKKLQDFNFTSTTLTNKTQFIREHMPYGSVLVVDDVQSNIYVAKGMLLPYGLKIDTASSGFEAIKKVDDGNVYDIIFMDHMMPKMDGIEATKIIRSMGYTQPIVALTANALIGKAEMFLQNGFDRFISKPIDSRELNIILNELIRNKQPSPIQKNNTNDELTALVAKDIENAIAVLEELLPELNSTKENLELYTTTVHGVKSALFNIGETQLSNAALKLEKESANWETSVITDETRELINSLRSFLEKL